MRKKLPTSITDPQFPALKAEWDKRLKDSGFEDVEDSRGNLKSWSSSMYLAGKNNDASFEDVILQNQAKEQYYRLAGQFLFEHHFKNEQEKLIWKLHSEDTSIRDIVEILKKRGNHVYKRKVHEIINNLCDIMLNRGKNE
jgi:hypothetical protein